MTNAYLAHATWKRPEAAALVKKALAQSLMLYALFAFKEEVKEKAARLPQVDGYVWILADDPADAAVLTLSPK